MAIHLVQRSNAFGACEQVAASADIIVLLGEGVAALSGGSAALSTDKRNAQRDLLATAVDIKERGLVDPLPDRVTQISDQQLVALCATHSPIVSWNQP